MIFTRILSCCFILVCSGIYAQAQALRKPVFKLLPVPTNVDASFRGVSVVNDDVAWVSGSKGTVGRTIFGSKFNFLTVKGYEHCDFRSIYAFDSLNAVIANAGAPAYILRTADGGITWTKVYENTDSAAFIDGIDFSDDEKQGIVYGDPINGKMLLLKTNDRGHSWQEMPDASRPSLQEGEASFAASGTCIRYMEKGRVLIATGGKVSRIWLSDDNGQSWNTISTPILQGAAGTGIFSVLPISKSKWIIAGGDYTRDTLRTSNLLYTINDGETWIAPKVTTRGYRECLVAVGYEVQGGLCYKAVPVILAVGPGGVDISRDEAKTWKPLSDEKKLHTARKARHGSLVVFAGGGGKIMVIQRWGKGLLLPCSWLQCLFHHLVPCKSYQWFPG
jgi:photosystem II stability/assembly factor-like uncharacterized protein